ncbi:MAG: hypothetical protein ACKPB9_27095, partial [Dolichospermum sp.]
MLLELKRIHVPPGQRVILENVTWKELETIIEELGEHRAARIAYDRGILEIMSPLPEHEFDKETNGWVPCSWANAANSKRACLCRSRGSSPQACCRSL